MDYTELKEYVKAIKDMEFAVYTQEKLMKEHKELIRQARPELPVKKEVKMLMNKPDPDKYKLEEYDNSDSIVSIVFIIVGIIALIVGCVLSKKIVTIASIIIGVIGIIGYVTSTSEKEKIEANNKRKKEGYERVTKGYEELLEYYNEDKAIAEEEYKEAKAKYDVEIVAYNNHKDEMTTKHDSYLLSSKTLLNQLYDRNVIFPKYRNLVTITMLCEYLESGRCYTLEGPDGAYNLYEMELRQNIVIGQLSSILNNLEQIRSNQFMLYEELSDANRRIENILDDIRNSNDAQLNLYFRYLEALGNLF